ncbi:MAG: hypothetical protein EOP92_21155 [Lysobacteraceae bacterium]|nr:MAG: hypothetical protein EOP92_21155 [Xanthomonadaceae bacterium]
MHRKTDSMGMCFLAALAVAGVLPQPASAAETTAANAPACVADGCRKGEDLIFRIHSYGEEQPAQAGDTDPELQANRRVQILAAQDSRGTSSVHEQGRAVVVGETSIQLPQGGQVWATEDPALTLPVLNVQGASMAEFEQGRIVRPVRFHAYSNYPSFIERIEVLVYRGTDTDLVTALATIPVPVASVGDAEWDGTVPAGLNLRADDELIYVARAYGKDGAFDETYTQRIRLVTPADFARGALAAQDEAQRVLGQSLDAEAAQSRQVSNAIYGQNALRLQNIGLYGSRIRLQGIGIAPGTRLSINGQNFPVDQEGKFAAEFIEPVGTHRYVVSTDVDGTEVERALELEVTGRYTYLVALADLTLSQNDVSGNIEPVSGDEHYDDGFLSEGRLAFYLKGKVRGKYLVTAHADTREREIEHLFDGFLDADPQDVFRRLDPDLYYPVYGDDSTTYRDVDTQGKLYVRVDWDQSQALWGNFATGFTGTEYGQYNRSLYGGALDWRSRGATALGDPRTLLKAFGSEAQTALGHSEFLGTGGSLYYLRHTDVLRGSEQVVLEVRDPTTGRTEARVPLQRGVDYEIDELQGRLLLTRPLVQVTRDNVRTLSRDTPLDGYDQLLLADYEYVPVGFDADDISIGVRGRHWFGDHVAVGGTYVDENRSGDDYSLRGADLTLQAGRGTYLKLEASRSESTVAPLFYSDNGGLSFVQRNPLGGARSGDAHAVEARANLKELGWTDNDWTVAAWWRRVDAGFSVSRFDSGADVEEYGAEFLGYFTDNFSLFGRHTHAERGAVSLEQTQLTADWRLGGDGRLGMELRQVQESHALSDIDALLAAVSYRHNVTEKLELYGVGQYTVDDDEGAYERNNLVTAGARYLFGDKSSVGAEVSSGSRGQGGKIDAEYRIDPDHTVYGAYSYSTDTTSRDPLFDRGLQSGWTVGQRWRLSNQVNIYNESQYLKDTRSDSAGLAHTFGLDFTPAPGWNLGFTLMDGELDSTTGPVDRRAYSVSGGRTDPRMQWSSKLEYRKDSGAEQREQWVTTNRLLFKINEDWRIAARANYADTQDDLNALASAKLAEANIGFAWRPHDNTRWAAFGKYTYLYDVATLGQEGGNQYDQRSQILSFEGITQLNDRWELGAKVARRSGDYRTGRGTGPWLDSDVDFAAIQVRFRLIARWEGLAEYRWLAVKDGGDKRGWLVGVDRQISENFKIGVGYNFTEFSDDLTDLEYDNRGWFLNLAGYY